MKKLFIFTTVPSLIIIFSLFNTFTFIPFADAQDAQSNCVLTQIGNPPQNQQLPAGCDSGGNGSVTWPYDKKAPSQFERVDQGWDLEYTTMGNSVRAVVPGTINYDHGSNPCNGGTGFGNTYPLEVMDKPITVNGRKYTEIYYGHTDGNQSLNGKHVNAGDVIAKTYDCVDEGSGFVPWLEIGFWGPGGPVGQAITPCKLDTTTTVPTQAGCDMKQWLNANTK